MITTAHAEVSVERKRQVLERLSISNSTLYRLVRAGAFPAPIRLTGRAVGWVSAEVDAWVARRRRRP